MKRNVFVALALLLYGESRAQGNYYTRFIQLDTAISWSAECTKVINLTPKVSDYSLKRWYLSRLKSGSVNAYTTDENGRSVASYPLSLPLLKKQDWLEGLNPEPLPGKSLKEWYFVDKKLSPASYERVKYRVEPRILSADSCCGCDEADAFRVKQILSYRNGQFFIYNVFLSPLCARRTDNSVLNWYPLCNLAYNDNENRKFPGLSKDVVLLNTDEIDYEFSRQYPTPEDSVLTVFRTDIGSLLYQDMLKGKIKPVDPETGKPLPVKKLMTIGMPVDTIAMLDENDPGSITGYKAVQQERNSTDFSRLRISQELYFDFKKERLYSRVRSVTIQLGVRGPDGTLIGYRSFCRLE